VWLISRCIVPKNAVKIFYSLDKFQKEEDFIEEGLNHDSLPPCFFAYTGFSPASVETLGVYNAAYDAPLSESSISPQSVLIP